jgi:hypothetical protein
MMEEREEQSDSGRYRDVEGGGGSISGVRADSRNCSGLDAMLLEASRKSIGEADKIADDSKLKMMRHERNLEADVGEVFEDDAFDFEIEDDDASGLQRWLAIARFYSGQNFNIRGMFKEMSRVWGLKEPIHARALGDNRFMLEFVERNAWEYVINGGSWRHKGDALIVVPYDGFTRPSEITFDKINMWIRVYDVPEALMTTGFARSCGQQLGDVLEVNGAVRDYLHVRIAFPLVRALRNQVTARIRGRSTVVCCKV